MPIYKYKSFEEAERALWNFHPDEAYFRKVADLWNYPCLPCEILSILMQNLFHRGSSVLICLPS
jgi:hypothetical protein